jgi:hypothetical protein
MSNYKTEQKIREMRTGTNSVVKKQKFTDQDVMIMSDLMCPRHEPHPSTTKLQIVDDKSYDTPVVVMPSPKYSFAA